VRTLKANFKSKFKKKKSELMLMRRVRAYIDAVPVRRLSWSISIHFVAIHAAAAKKSHKNYENLYF